MRRAINVTVLSGPWLWRSMRGTGYAEGGGSSESEPSHVGRKNISGSWGRNGTAPSELLRLGQGQPLGGPAQQHSFFYFQQHSTTDVNAALLGQVLALGKQRYG